MNNKKVKIESLISVIIIAVTIGFLVTNDDFYVFLENLETLSMQSILGAVALLLAYVLLESVIIKIIMTTLEERVSFGSCCRYSFLGFFFYCITPAGSGEQPSQLVAMHKDGIDVPKTVFALAIITITFKLAIVALGGAVYIIRPALVMTMISRYSALCIIGMVLSIAVIVAFICLLFVPSNVKGVANFVVKILCGLRILRDREKHVAKVDQFVSRYGETVNISRRHPFMLVVVLLVTIVQRACLLAITVLASNSIAVGTLTAPTIITAQGMIQLATEMMPLPGGAGLNEWLFMRTFESFFADDTLSVLIISRGISFYGQLIICGAVSAVLKVSRKSEE